MLSPLVGQVEEIKLSHTVRLDSVRLLHTNPSGADDDVSGGLRPITPVEHAPWWLEIHVKVRRRLTTHSHDGHHHSLCEAAGCMVQIML